MALFRKKQEYSIDNIILPEHVGIIMDGNGRWAKKRGLPRSAGHSAGAKNFRKIIRYCSDIGIKYLTMYAFSTENWKRPQDEVDALMKLFKQYTGKTAAVYLNDYRLEKAKSLLLHTDNSVTDIATEAGFNNTSYFIKKFQSY